MSLDKPEPLGIVSYDMGILGAEIKLTALSSKQGHILREACSWELKQLDKQGEASSKIYATEAAQHSMIVPPGCYVIHFIRDSEDKYGRLAAVELKQNTLTDIVFIFEEGGIEDEYFADYDPLDDFSRRQHERDVHIPATLPLRDPHAPKGEMGTQFMAHPLLQNAQFDGVPPDMRSDPHENEMALQLTLENKLAAKASPSISPNASPG